MPCRSGDEDCVTPAAPEHVSAPAWMLCEAMVILSNEDLLSECSVQLQAWWREHQVKEAGRVRAEAAAKLTIRERLALNIDIHGNSIAAQGTKRQR